MDINGTTAQIFFTVATAPDDQPVHNAGEHLPTHCMAGNSGLKAVYRNGQSVDQRAVEPYVMEHPILGGAKPTDDRKKAESENEAVFLAEMRNELTRNKGKSLPERWVDQAFRDDALARFMLVDDNILGRQIISDDCLKCSNKLLSIGAVPNDDVQKAIDALVERKLLQDKILDAIRYKHIWAAAKCPLKEKQVDQLLHSINEQLFSYSIYHSMLHQNEVYLLRSILMIPGTTLTPSQQQLLNMAYIKVKHEGHAQLTKSLQELGGHDDHEALYNKLLTIDKKIEQLTKTLDEMKNVTNAMNKKLNKPRSRCTIL